MIAADTLARELGCTLADLEDLDGTGRTIKADMLFRAETADIFRFAWSKKTGVDYITPATDQPAPFPVRPDRVAAQHALNTARSDYMAAWRKFSAARLRVFAAVDSGAQWSHESRCRQALIRRSAELRDAEVTVNAAERALSKVLAS